MSCRLSSFFIVVLWCFMNSIYARDFFGQDKPDGAAQRKAFKVKTELMEIRAVVTDHKGRIVEDLKKEDFELLENDKPREVSFFSVTNMDGRDNLRLYKNTAKEKGVTPENAPRQMNTLPGRTTVVFVDNANLSFSSLNWAKQALRQFVNDRMTSRDLLAIATSNGNLGIAQQFTQDRQMLHFAIERIGYGRPTSRDSHFTPYLAARIVAGDKDALILAAQILAAEELIYDHPPFYSLTKARAIMIINEASYQREISLYALKGLIEQMIGMPGQRMIAFISDGFTMYGRDGSLKSDELQSVISLAVRSGVVVYAMDAKGLQPRPDASAPPVVALLDAIDPMGYFTASDHEKLDAMVAMAKDTGGEIYINSNDLSDALARAFDANRCYYVLAYYLTPDANANTFRNIHVRIRDHPEYTVRTARGYVPANSIRDKEDETIKTPQQRLIMAVNAPLRSTQLNVAAWADFIGDETDNQQVLLTIQFEGSDLRNEQQAEFPMIAVEILYTVYDSTGKQVDSVSAHIKGTLTPERMHQAQTNGYAFLKRLSLKPGVYQVRTGVREEITDRIGTATAWIEVPNLEHTKLVLSDLTFLNPIFEKVADSAPTNEGELRGIRTVQGVRIYPRDSVCGYYFRLYYNRNSLNESNILMKTELLQNSKPVKQSDWKPIPMNNGILNDKDWTYVGQKLDLTGLQPGIYELSLSVKDGRTNKVVLRSAVFAIE